MENVKQNNNIVELDQGIQVDPIFPLVVVQCKNKKAQTYLTIINITDSQR